MLFEMVFVMSQNLASCGQPTRIAHMWRISTGHNTLPTNHLLLKINISYMKMTNPSFSKQSKGLYYKYAK